MSTLRKILAVDLRLVWRGASRMMKQFNETRAALDSGRLTGIERARALRALGYTHLRFCNSEDPNCCLEARAMIAKADLLGPPPPSMAPVSVRP